MLRNKMATLLKINIQYISWKNSVALRIFFSGLMPAILDA